MKYAVDRPDDDAFSDAEDVRIEHDGQKRSQGDCAAHGHFQQSDIREREGEGDGDSGVGDGLGIEVKRFFVDKSQSDDGEDQSRGRQPQGQRLDVFFGDVVLFGGFARGVIDDQADDDGDKSGDGKECKDHARRLVFGQREYDRGRKDESGEDQHRYVAERIDAAVRFVIDVGQDRKEDDGSGNVCAADDKKYLFGEGSVLFCQGHDDKSERVSDGDPEHHRTSGGHSVGKID